MQITRDLGWKPSIYDIIEYMSGLPSDKQLHLKKAVRLYLKFIKRKDLLEFFEGGWSSSTSSGDVVTISLAEALGAISLASYMDPVYAIYLCTLLVTGLRPCEVKSITWDNQLVALDPRIFKLEKMERKTKRAYYAFTTPALLEALEKLKDRPRRRTNKIVIYRREVEYEVLKKIKHVYQKFEPRLLRDVNSWILTKAGIQETIVKFIHGWTSKEVFYKHYLRPQMTREEALLEILHMHNQALKEIDKWLRENILAKL